MATIIGSTNHANWDFKLEVSEGTASIAGNTSPVTVTAYIGRNGVASYMYGASISCTVGVTGCSNQTITYNNSGRVDVAVGQWVSIGSTTFSAVPHNADGSKVVYVSANFTNNISPKSGSAGGNVTLATIPRTSKPTLSASTIEMGKAVTITTNRASTSFTHKLFYGWYDSGWVQIATGVGASHSWTIPLSFANDIPNSTSGWGTIRCETYNGSTKIGTEDVTFTATVPASVKPSCTMTLEDITGIDDTYGSPVQGLSKIKVTVNPTTAYGSAIKSYYIAIDGDTFSTSTATSGTLKNSGSSLVVVGVTDSRGRRAAATYTMNVQAYTRPSVSKLTVHRCNANGTENQSGAYIKVIFSASVSEMSGLKNTATYKVSYKKSSATSFTDATISSLTNVYSVSNQSYVFSADTGSSYDVKITVTDRHYETEEPTSASTAFALVHAGADGESLALGKVSEKAGWLENNLPTENLQDTVQIGNSYTFSSPGTAGADGYVKMARITHTQVNADSPVTFVFSRRNCKQPMTVHVQFKPNSTTIDPALSSITYEGDNYGAFLVHAATSVWDLYVQKVSAFDTITLQNWYCSATTGKRLTVTFPGGHVSSVPEGLNGYYRATPAKLQSILDFVYPVGSIYLSYNHTNPGTLFGGTWVRIQNAFLWAVDSSGTIGATGGEKTHTLTVDEMPSHSHYGKIGSGSGSNTDYVSVSITSGGVNNTWWGAVKDDNTGGGAAHNNMPPYIQVSAWRRTA